MAGRARGNSGSQQQPPPPPPQEQQGGGGGKKRNRNRGRGGGGVSGQDGGSDRGGQQERGPPREAAGDGRPPQQGPGSGGPPRGPPGGPGLPRGPPAGLQGPGPRSTSPFITGPRNAPPPFSQKPPVVEPASASKPAWGKPGPSSAPPPVAETSSMEPALPQQSKPGKKKGKKGGAKQGEETPQEAPPAPVQAPQKDPPLPQPVQRGKGKPQDRPSPGPSKAVSSPVEDITKQLAQTSVTWSGDSFIIPRRPDGQAINRKQALFQKKFTLEVNYLPISFKDINLKIFHYDVVFNPDRPKSLYRPALRILLDRYVKNRHPAFDGKKNLYSGGTKLGFPTGDTVRDTVRLTDPERGSEVEFDITVKLVAQNLSLSKLAEYLRSGTSTNIPQDVIQGIDIALRNAPTMNSSFVPVGRSFFAIPREEPTILGSGFELWHGHYQSAIMSWKPYLNVDVANKAFPIPQSLLAFIKHDLDEDPNRMLEQNTRNKLLRFVKGLKIDYKIKSNDPGGFTKRTYKVNDLGDPPNRHRFKPDKEGSREITVEQYFRDVKRITLQYPHLPCIVTSNRNYLPLEFCHITPNQAVMRKLDEKQTATMVRSAAKGTDIRKERIMKTIGQSGFNQDPCAREFGIQLSPNFEKVDAYILKPPIIRYANDRETQVKNGVWQTRSGEKFIQSPGLESWVILNTDKRTGPQQINNLVKNFQQTGNSIGIPVNEPRQIIDVAGRIRTEADFEREFRQLKDKVQIVVVIMASFGVEDIYSKIKRAAELKVGVLTQCIKSATCDFRKMNSMTAHNILLKINSKISGVNHALGRTTTPAILREPVMIVGADVTHPAPGSEGLSIAAVAASHDSYAFRYNMLYRLQPGRQEMIERLQEMIEQQLMFFYQRCNCKPKRILYYRDGVSEGQFLQVLNIELRAIRAACKKIEKGYEPAVTFLVVQKRHHTRFFPSPQDWDGPKNKNVYAGTLVDTTITHPTEVDFYLVSHQSIQGTARPTKYHLLWDDNKIPQDDLEQLTYYLCHMFARCNRSVSYPAPTYYAHLAAFRARAWWDGQRYDSTNLQTEQATKGRIQDHIVNNAPMFFV